MNLKAIELKTLIPAKDFKTSLGFYQVFGFEKRYEDEQIAYFAYGDQVSFLLQNFYEKDLAENLVQHLLVEDIDAWYSHLNHIKLAEVFSVRMTPIEEKPWGMKEFHVFDPSGVLWTIAQNL
ncbi:VOC family protein [Flavobacterium sp. HSC-61S13]|uniref:VOC family protein n=1 Tax=Flavobacterium sp. HSC-61S13 TaxID=2910963 RepID=UPI00209F8EE4|nr:VOC family protein [Flavobacterium sp. HSC-61S13]MCP1996211.1 putative glyoxalase superfamily protein PhnB [Flavobacterium sp. HSC-61S13]